MQTHFDIEKIIEKGSISNELDYERALIADRKLRLLASDSLHFKNLRLKLRNLLEKYESTNWIDVDKVDELQIKESDESEIVAESESRFIENRKQSIRKRLKELDLTQENLATLLGHKSKTHMSELLNGIKPFTLKDLIIINRILKIDMSILVPVFLSKKDQSQIKEAVYSLNNPKIRLAIEDLVLC